jgi:hypothetical protein
VEEGVTVNSHLIGRTRPILREVVPFRDDHLELLGLEIRKVVRDSFLESFVHDAISLVGEMETYGHVRRREALAL